MKGKQGYSLIGGVDDLVKQRERRLQKPEKTIYPTFVVSQNLTCYKDIHYEFLKVQTEIAEKEYRLKPEENIPDLKRDDYWINQSSAFKLPQFIYS